MLYCQDGKFCRSDEKALNAQNIETGNDVYLDGEFEAKGTVQLSGAKIGGMLSCRGGKFYQPGGKALDAQNIETGGDVYLDEGFRAEGKVVLNSARVSRKLSLKGGVFADEFDLQHTEALRLVDDMDSWPAQGKLFLEGFKYEEIAYNSPVRWKDRRKWLERQKGFVPGSYEQLSKVYRARGDVRSARKMLIAKYERQIKSTEFAPWEWGPVKISATLRWYLSPVLFLRRLLGFVVGYRHEPWRAIWFLIGLVFFAWIMFTHAAAGQQVVPVEEPHNLESLEREMGNRALQADECNAGRKYPCFHGFVYAVDTAVPLVDLRQQSYWIPIGWHQWVMWGVTAAGWLLVSAVAIGLTLLFRE